MTQRPLYLTVQRAFSTSSVLLALRNHRLFPKVDWERVEAGQYAVVDPVNPGVILYLSEQDYIVMVRVAITSNRTLKVLAHPGDSPDASSNDPNTPSQNSPAPDTFAHPYLDGLAYGNQKIGTAKARHRLQTMFNSVLSTFRHKERVVSNIGVKTLEKTSMIILTSRNTMQWVTSWTNQLHWWLKGRPMSTVAMAERNTFGQRVLKLLRHNGSTALIARMKISLFAVNSYLAGNRLVSTQNVGMRVQLRSGLPAILPLYVRNGIRSLDRAYIHMWASVLFSYKGLMGTWKEPEWLSSTIQAKHPDYSSNDAYNLFQQFFAETFWRALADTLSVKVPTIETFQVKNLFFTAHAGPNHPNSVLGAGVDAWLWTTQPRNLLREWLEATSQKELLKEFRLSGKAYRLTADLLRNLQEKESTSPVRFLKSLLGANLEDTKELCLARLHKLYEAAGKVRVIAIVDYWTNAVLKPVHDWMFSVLERLPQDATFDQNGRTREFAARGYTDVYSLDLKSATDLIPIALYRALFAWVFPMRVLDLWIDLLVSRDFLTPPEHRGIDASRLKLRYTCGQPMGALTSWASMALLHHALVLFAAVRAGVVSWPYPLTFRDYLVLGDDVVIASKPVAEAYLALASELCIPISLHKSFISETGMFNFANQTYLTDLLEGSDRKRTLLNDGRPFNASPISMREEAVIDSLPARAELATRIIDRGMVDLSGNNWLSRLVKLFVSPKVWTGAIRPALEAGQVHPVVSWILSVLFTPGSCRFASLGLGKISIGAYLATQLRKGTLWSKPLRSIHSLNLGRTEALQISILARWADKIYKEFLVSRKRLEAFDPWIEGTVSADLDYVLKRLFKEQKSESIKRWTEAYRLPLKELIVTTQITSISSIHVIEIGTGRKWDELINFIAEAESALPRVPDFISNDIQVLSSVLGDPLQWVKSQQDRAVASFLRVTNVLGVIDHLGSLATPGIVIGPVDKTVSSNSQTRTDKKE